MRACGIRSFARRGNRSRRSSTSLGLCLVGWGRLALAPTRLLFPSHSLLALSLQPLSNLGQNPLALVVSTVAMTMMVRRESCIVNRSNRWRSSCRQPAAQSASGSRWTALLAMVRIVFDIVLGDRIGNLHGFQSAAGRRSSHRFVVQLERRAQGRRRMGWGFRHLRQTMRGFFFVVDRNVVVVKCCEQRRKRVGVGVPGASRRLNKKKKSR